MGTPAIGFTCLAEVVLWPACSSWVRSKEIPLLPVSMGKELRANPKHGRPPFRNDHAATLPSSYPPTVNVPQTENISFFFPPNFFNQQA